jgi:hypothetical protein
MLGDLQAGPASVKVRNPRGKPDTIEEARAIADPDLFSRLVPPPVSAQAGAPL